MVYAGGCAAKAFSSKVCAALREENALIQEVKAFLHFNEMSKCFIRISVPSHKNKRPCRD